MSQKLFEELLETGTHFELVDEVGCEQVVEIFVADTCECCGGPAITGQVGVPFGAPGMVRYLVQRGMRQVDGPLPYLSHNDEYGSECEACDGVR